MRLDDSPTDCQSHAHAFRLGRKKGIENTLEIRWIQTFTRIAHRDDNVISFICSEITNNSRAPSLLFAIASRPFMIRFKTTCCN